MWLFTFYWTILPLTALILLARWVNIWWIEREYKQFENDFKDRPKRSELT